MTQETGMDGDLGSSKVDEMQLVLEDTRRRPRKVQSFMKLSSDKEDLERELVLVQTTGDQVRVKELQGKIREIDRKMDVISCCYNG